ncbi:transcription factor PAR1-like [Macadamia integrifolia]|uniref:transcription factor PAR1-like n=1 Tax=Macadamia integrifolia TaxID=60698 RepID=UPI001C50041B|nr:transcription factor PAR1-like [Macadamia integrifolia]
MDTAKDHEVVSPTFPTAEKKRTHQECEDGHEPHQSSNGLLQSRRHSKPINKRLLRKQRSTREKLQKSNACGDQGDEEKVGIEKRIMLLKSIIPGGQSLGIDKLFEETALYILSLQGQVKAMKILTSFFETLEKEKSMSKFGG